MVKSIVVCTALMLCPCVTNEDVSFEETTSNIKSCVGLLGENNEDRDRRCCDNTEDICENSYETGVLGRYLEYPALSNGECTGGGSGAYQCATFAQNLWFQKLKYAFTRRWLVAARALQCASIEEGLFIFRNGSPEPPRETDILVYLNVGQNEPTNCHNNLSNEELNALYAHPGHVSIVSGVTRNDNGRVTYLRLIEENLVLPPEVQACDNNLADSVMREVGVVFRNNGYFVDSGSSTLQVIGWIRHPLVGIYGDTGWHEDEDDGVVDGHSLSQSFRAVYERWDSAFLGWSYDNGGTPFVHTRNGHLLQDFVTSNGQGRALVYNPGLGTALLIRDGFYAVYLGRQGTTGLPLDEEHPGVCLSVQNFENGYMCWTGWVVYWFSSGVLPPPMVESKPPLDNSDSNGESDPEASPPEESEPEEANSPPECYENDWLPCYTGSISTPNIGLCQGGRVLCERDHWQWNACVGEITPSPENCLDGLDNDCDGLSDCLDANCAGSAGCPTDLGGSEEFQAAGAEGEDQQNQINCDADGDGYLALSCGGDDCNDRNASIYPGALEICNYLDDDCNGWFDEWGMRNRCNTCGPVPIEVCGDDFDNDCDQRVDEGCPRDSDGDGYFTPGDCDDLASWRYPGAVEECADGVDDDCDDQIDEGCPGPETDGPDADGDGYSPPEDCEDLDSWRYPGAREYCNCVDDDCDGEIDEGCGMRC